MAKDKQKEKERRKRTLSSSPSPSSSSSSDSRIRKRKHSKNKSSSSKSSKRKDYSHREKRKRRRSDRTRGSSDDSSDDECYKREKRKRGRSRRTRGSSAESASDDESASDGGFKEKKVLEENEIVRRILVEFPDLAPQIHQILEMIDNGQGVNLTGISDKPLRNSLKKLFISLNLEKNEKGIYCRHAKSTPVLDAVGPTLMKFMKPSKINNEEIIKEEIKNMRNDDVASKEEEKEETPSPPKRRIIGPAMPSRELLQAAAELTQANDLLREAGIEDDGVLIGPPPPALVAEAESANEAERFEEVTRIMGADANSPYDVLGINWKMVPENMKKKYWKSSLLVHPDKCSHPYAQEAFVILNKAFKDLQDPNIRGAIDDKLRAKEEQEKMRIELRSMREAAQMRQARGIMMEGDEELLAAFVPKEEPKRDEWMTALPPEKKAGMAMHSTTAFSKTAKEGRGDTSAWTDTPLDKANKAKQNYLEAYDRTKAIADSNVPSGDTSLVDMYTSSKRSISLVEKHQQEKKKKEKKKHKQKQEERGEREEEWEGAHPWKPWDREKDLTAGRKSVNFDPQNMSKDLGSRFSAGPTQRNFL